MNNAIIYDRMDRINGIVTITLRDDDGCIIQERTQYNALVDLGKNLLLNRLINNTEIDPITYIAVGIGSSEIDSGETGMQGEVARRGAIYTKSTTATLDLKLSAYFESDYPVLSDYEISEVALYGGAATVESGTGTIVARVLISNPITKQRGTHSVTVDYHLAW